MCLLSVAFLLSGCASTDPGDGAVVRLEAARVLPVESPFAVEPSGLCLKNGRLYSISDDTENMIFEVVLEDEHARFVPVLEFSPPDGTEGRLDLEGIAAGPGGGFFLVSERFARVLQVFPDGHSEWASPSGLSAGRAGELFQNRAGLAEGLTRLPDGGFLLAAERQPRGLLGYTEESGFIAQPMPATRYAGELSLLRPPDFTGLDYHAGKVWVLHRNAGLVGTLERAVNGWREGPVAWSFQAILESPVYAFRDSRFGLAEGLAVGERFFYVIVDNNGDSRASDSTDHRPLLLVLDRPKEKAGPRH